MPNRAQGQNVKVTISFPAKVWEAVGKMAHEDGVSRTEFLRRAIATEEFRREVRDARGKLVVELEDGTRERIRFPY